MNDLLTPRELAIELKVSLAWIRKHTPQLPHMRAGRLVRFSKNEIEHFLKMQRNGKGNERAA